MIVENRIVRNFRCVLLATFGIMSVMLFIWCFDSTLAPYTMNSFFSRFSKLSEVLMIMSVSNLLPKSYASLKTMIYSDGDGRSLKNISTSMRILTTALRVCFTSYCDFLCLVAT